MTDPVITINSSKFYLEQYFLYSLGKKTTLNPAKADNLAEATFEEIFEILNANTDAFMFQAIKETHKTAIIENEEFEAHTRKSLTGQIFILENLLKYNHPSLFTENQLDVMLKTGSSLFKNYHFPSQSNLKIEEGVQAMILTNEYHKAAFFFQAEKDKIIKNNNGKWETVSLENAKEAFKRPMPIRQ